MAFRKVEPCAQRTLRRGRLLGIKSRAEAYDNRVADYYVLVARYQEKCGGSRKLVK